MSTQIVFDKTWKRQVLSALGTYARAFAAASLTLYMAGERRWQALLSAGIASILPVVLRAINPNDTSYGLITPVYTGSVEEEPKP